MNGERHGGNVWQGGEPGGWLDFSASLRPEGPPPWAVEAMRRGIDEARFYPDREMRGAREGLASWLGVPPECVLPTAGGMAAIDLALAADRGTVYTERTTFGEYALRAAAHGRKRAEWQGCCAAGDTVVLCNPNNPTGAAREREEVLSLAETVQGRGARLLVDEAFVSFCPEVSVAGEMQSGVIVAGSLTKALCLPGIRLGYLCADLQTIKRMEELALPWALSAPAACVAQALPEHRQELAADAERNRIRRESFAAALRALGAKVGASRANFLLADFGRDMTAAAARLKAERILVRTCASFALGPGFWRLGVRTEAENGRLIDALSRILKEEPCGERA
ncbi:MAG: histidinol-phosphate aminotransferase family protein [Clostridia bacterium]|nr:histidinol-phosphate aminotransferase family protein [Clostridia bacterium]